MNIDHPIVHESCGKISADILAVVADREADVIAVAPAANSVFEVAILGRVSPAVLRQAECDVFVIPPS